MRMIADGDTATELLIADNQSIHVLDTDIQHAEFAISTVPNEAIFSYTFGFKKNKNRD